MERRAEERNGSGTSAHGTSIDAGLTARLAELATTSGALTDAWRDLGERAFADTVGVLVAGASDPGVSALAAALDETGGPARSVATGASLSTRSAALLDGTAAHALDYDDVDDAIIGHPSAVLVPALLAAGGGRDPVAVGAGGGRGSATGVAAGRRGSAAGEAGEARGSAAGGVAGMVASSGADGPARPDIAGEALLDAFRVGIEAGRTVASAMDTRADYERGWHTTGTIGALSATTALARLHRLDDGATRRALGVAGSLAAGSRQNFGTETKPLHAGVAASTAVLAVRIAAGGFTADPAQLDGPLGYLALHAGGGAVVGHVPTPPGGTPPGLNLKLFPCCYYVHAAAEAAIRLGYEVDDLAAIARVEVVVQPGGLAPLIHHRPVDGTQAKFSMEYTAAACLTDRELTFGSFTPDAVNRAPVRELLERVEIREEPVPPVGAATDGPFAVVSVHLGADVLSARVDNPEGHATRPVTWPRLREKFDDCVPGPAEAAWDGLRNLRAVTSVRDLVATLTELTGRADRADRADRTDGAEYADRPDHADHAAHPVRSDRAAPARAVDPAGLRG